MTKEEIFQAFQDGLWEPDKKKKWTLRVGIPFKSDFSEWSRKNKLPWIRKRKSNGDFAISDTIYYNFKPRLTKDEAIEILKYWKKEWGIVELKPWSSAQTHKNKMSTEWRESQPIAILPSAKIDNNSEKNLLMSLKSPMNWDQAFRHPLFDFINIHDEKSPVYIRSIQPTELILSPNQGLYHLYSRSTYRLMMKRECSRVNLGFNKGMEQALAQDGVRFAKKNEKLETTLIRNLAYQDPNHGDSQFRIPTEVSRAPYIVSFASRKDTKSLMKALEHHQDLYHGIPLYFCKAKSLKEKEKAIRTWYKTGEVLSCFERLL